MRLTKLLAALAALFLMVAIVSGCSQNRANPPSVKENVEKSLDQANLKDVDVDEDRDKRVIRLQGNVKTEEDKARAGEIAKANAGSFIVANEIGVRPEGMEGDAREIDGNVDDGIKNNLEAAFIANKLEDQRINIDVKSGVVTLKGDVDTLPQRKRAEKIAAQIPNVVQVVNELEVKK